MVFILISFIAAIVSGAGVGGGSIFILLITTFNLLDYKTTMVCNLIMFVIVGITATINNIKTKKFDKKLFFKLIFFSLAGSFFGVRFAREISADSIRKYFYIFILIIGIYEIISSLISFKKEKI